MSGTRQKPKRCRHSYWFGWDMRPRCVKCGKVKPIKVKAGPREDVTAP